MSDAMIWEPVADGEVSSFMYVDNGGKLLGVYAGNEYSDWYATEDLPDDIRLCRQVPDGEVSVPVEMIRICTSYGMPLGITYAEYNAARDKVLAWLNTLKGNE